MEDNLNHFLDIGIDDFRLVEFKPSLTKSSPTIMWQCHILRVSILIHKIDVDHGIWPPQGQLQEAVKLVFNDRLYHQTIFRQTPVQNDDEMNKDLETAIVNGRSL